MPRTKKQPSRPRSRGRHGPVTGDVLTLAEAAAYLRVRKAMVTAIIAHGLPAKLIGGEWRFAKAAFGNGSSSAKPTVDVMRWLRFGGSRENFEC